jgi:hypothetical protein
VSTAASTYRAGAVSKPVGRTFSATSLNARSVTSLETAPTEAPTMFAITSTGDAMRDADINCNSFHDAAERAGDRRHS